LARYTQENRLLQVFTPLGKDVLLLQSLTGHEGISSLFHFDLRMHSEKRDISFEDIVGKPALVKIIRADGDFERLIHGVISSFTQGGSSVNFAHYHATLVPSLWLLTRTTDCRIFQEKSVPDIIQQILKEYGAIDFSLRLHGNYEPREYCVQYRETDFNFVSRLMEEEGIFYFFEHAEDKHTLVLADHPSEFKPCPGQPSARYEVLTGEKLRVEDVIDGWSYGQEVKSGKFEARDFNFEKPSMKLVAAVDGKDSHKLEIYDYPGEYPKINIGEQLIKVRMEEENTSRVIASGNGNCRAFIPGFRFELKDHYRADLNQEYVLTHVYHTADQGDNYETTSEDAAEVFEYANSFQCIPHPTPFRPPRTTPVPIVHGSQTAIVVGPAGEEIYVDKYGRVKVQFHWDREGDYNEKSSCWVRVSQNWAGKRWGAMFIPRIGQEVIVDFLEGNPDNPIITGRVYNGESMPPYTLPDEKTKSAIKSYSSKGGGGFNEIRFEDKKGDEQLFFHAEKDMDIRVKNDRREWIGRDRHLIVKRDKREKVERDTHALITRDQIEEIGRDHHLKIKGKEAIEITGSRSLKVTGDVNEEFTSNHSQQVTGSLYLKGMNVVIEAMTSLTIQVGGNFVNINPGGVFIQGTMVMINSGGSAGAGSPGSLVPPTAPQEAEIADTADPGDKEPTYKQQRAQLSPIQLAALEAPSHNPQSEENKEKKSWIEIELVDEAGQPVPGERYRVTLPDGTTLADGTLDEKGQARIENIDPGTCKITFPDLDKDAWEPK
jgi:type VI secretion system secreted protein VgrG